MPRPRKAVRPVHKNISLPEDLVAQTDLLLYSEVEGRVPSSAWSNLLSGLLRDYLKNAAGAAASAAIAAKGAQP